MIRRANTAVSSPNGEPSESDVLAQEADALEHCPQLSDHEVVRILDLALRRRTAGEIAEAVHLTWQQVVRCIDHYMRPELVVYGEKPRVHKGWGGKRKGAGHPRGAR
jgi:hypothetical protein